MRIRTYNYLGTEKAETVAGPSGANNSVVMHRPVWKDARLQIRTGTTSRNCNLAPLCSLVLAVTPPNELQWKSSRTILMKIIN